MPVNSDNYNNDAILGAQLEQLVQKVLQKYVEGSNVIAEMGNNFDARLKAVEDALELSNVGAFMADSVETQSLKVSGYDLAEALDSKIGNVKAAAGPNIGSVGTPSVTVTNNPTTHESTLTFNYLKGSKGDQGNAGTAAGFGTPTATVDANVGTPSVSVSASGPNTAKVFSFEFSNLKGVKGDKGDKGDTGNNGTNGTNGVGVSSVTMNYAASNSGTTAPSSGWSSTIPSVSGQYLWARADILLTNNTHQYMFSVSFIPDVQVVIADGPQSSYTSGVLYLI